MHIDNCALRRAKKSLHEYVLPSLVGGAGHQDNKSTTSRYRSHDLRQVGMHRLYSACVLIPLLLLGLRLALAIRVRALRRALRTSQANDRAHHSAFGNVH